MKRFLSMILSLAFLLSMTLVPASAELRTIDLYDMTVEELDSLSTEIKHAKKAITELDKDTQKLLEDDFSSILQAIADAHGEDGKIKYPFWGLDTSRELNCYQVWGDCSAKFPDKSKLDFSGARIIFYYDESTDSFLHVAFLTNNDIYYVDSELVPKVARCLDDDTLARLGVNVENVKMDDVSFTPEPTQEPTPEPTPRPTYTPTLKPTNTPEPTVDPETLYSQLKKGSKGEAVKQLQQRLIELGYLSDKADGVFGNNTEKAIEAFQSQNGFPTDGIATAALQATLFAKGAISSLGIPMTAYDPNSFATPTPKPTPTPKVVRADAGSQRQSSSSGKYVGNANTGKFHKASCGSVKQMKESNKVFFDSRDEAVSYGYVPCKKCHP